VAVLGSWIQQSLFESGPLTDTMDAIGSATGETVLLGLQNGPHMQYVHIVVPSQGVLLAAQVGTLRPMTCAALGRVLLSRKTNEEIKAIVRRNNADAADSVHRVQERQFMVEIESIRSQGFAESRGKMVPGANVIGMLIPDRNDTTPLAIGVGGPMVRIEERRDEILRVLRRYLHRK
jgi:IclR family KDG regulon transcriptional repressor